MFRLILTTTKRYWIVGLFVMLGILSAYTNLPMYAQSATPTPDVQTVPKLETPPAPTNTPFPTPTPNVPSGGNGPVATAQPGDNGSDDNDDADDNDDDNDTDSGNNDTGNSNNNGSGNNSGGNSNPGSGSSSGGSTTNPGSGTAGTQSGSAQPTKTGLTGAVTAVTLNMRKGPSVNDHIIDTLFMNDVVEITGRDSSGNWWYICCGSRAQLAGWVSAQLITPNFAATQANTLIPVLSNSANQPAVAQTGVTTGTTSAPALVLEMRPLPAFAWQGQTIDLHFVVRNKSANAISNIQLRDDLPPDLSFVKATIGSQGVVTDTAITQSDSIFAIEWPELAANGQVTATVTVRIQPETASGVLIDNLAQVTTSAGDAALAGITIAMPPVALPQFR